MTEPLFRDAYFKTAPGRVVAVTAPCGVDLINPFSIQHAAVSHAILGFCLGV